MSENKKDKYIREQDRCGLKVGNKVKVVRSAEDHEDGWSNTWPEQMDEMIGKELEITKLSFFGIQLDNRFSYPFFVLELMPGYPSDKVLKCPMCGWDMCVMDKMSEAGKPETEDYPDVIIFEYNCTNLECGMSAYYPFQVSEVSDGESYFK